MKDERSHLLLESPFYNSEQIQLGGISMKNLSIPEDIRNLYKRAAYVVYDAIAGDCPEMESYSSKAKQEIIRDASHLQNIGLQALRGEDRVKLMNWLRDHEYDAAYERDQKRAIKEVVG